MPWTLIGALVGVLATLLVVALVHRPSVTEREFTLAAPGFACPAPRWATSAPVTSGAGAQSESVAVVKLDHALQAGGNVDVAGGLSGALPSGTHLFLVTWPDPATGDANGRYYPTTEIAVTGGSCFQAPRHSLHPGGSTATEVREMLVLVRRDADAFARDRASGYNQTDLFTRGVAVLGWITVRGA